jgi:hypothetical protein
VPPARGCGEAPLVVPQSVTPDVLVQAFRPSARLLG